MVATDLGFLTLCDLRDLLCGFFPRTHEHPPLRLMRTLLLLCLWPRRSSPQISRSRSRHRMICGRNNRTRLQRLAFNLFFVPFLNLLSFHGLSHFTLSFRVRQIGGASFLSNAWTCGKKPFSRTDRSQDGVKNIVEGRFLSCSANG
jgi:hypothetical protein